MKLYCCVLEKKTKTMTRHTSERVQHVTHTPSPLHKREKHLCFQCVWVCVTKTKKEDDAVCRRNKNMAFGAF